MTAHEVTEVGKKMKVIVDYVRECQARVTKGEIMDLQGLDKNVMELCDAIAELPEKDGHSLEDQMGVLIESLEVLARTMKEQQSRFTPSGAG